MPHTHEHFDPTDGHDPTDPNFKEQEEKRMEMIEKTADAMLSSYEGLRKFPFTYLNGKNFKTLEKLHESKEIDLCEVITEDGKTLFEYLSESDKGTEESLKLNETSKEAIRESLIDVLKESNSALTPTQRLLMAVGTDLAGVTATAVSLMNQRKAEIKMFKSMYEESKLNRSRFRRFIRFIKSLFERTPKPKHDPYPFEGQMSPEDITRDPIEDEDEIPIIDDEPILEYRRSECRYETCPNSDECKAANLCVEYFEKRPIPNPANPMNEANPNMREYVMESEPNRDFIVDFKEPKSTEEAFEFVDKFDLNLNVKIVDLNLSVRCKSTLIHNKIKTLYDVLELGRVGLYMLRNFGQKSMLELEGEVTRLGYKLKD
jgi:hypothetical protein